MVREIWHMFEYCLALKRSSPFLGHSAKQAAQDAKAILHVAELAELVIRVVCGAKPITSELHVKPASL